MSSQPHGFSTRRVSLAQRSRLNRFGESRLMPEPPPPAPARGGNPVSPAPPPAGVPSSRRHRRELGMRADEFVGLTELLGRIDGEPEARVAVGAQLALGRELGERG